MQRNPFKAKLDVNPGCFMTDIAKPYRDETLRRIGRNIVNFQKLEHSLRVLIPTLRFSSGVDEIASIQAIRKNEVKKKSLGDLSSRFHGDIFSEIPDSISDSATGITISHSFRLETDKNDARELKNSLIKLVQERNQLVHQDFIYTVFNSIPECYEISARLDEQNSRILSQIDFVNSLRKSHSEASAEIAKYLMSDEFWEKISLTIKAPNTSL